MGNHGERKINNMTMLTFCNAILLRCARARKLMNDTRIRVKRSEVIFGILTTTIGTNNFNGGIKKIFHSIFKVNER